MRSRDAGFALFMAMLCAAGCVFDRTGTVYGDDDAGAGAIDARTAGAVDAARVDGAAGAIDATTAGVDAATAVADAALSLVDAADPIDATPPADARPPVTVWFGETADDDVSGVTTDTDVRWDFADRNYGASVALSMDASPYRAALLRFDISSIPVGATVTDVTLVVWTNDDLQDEGTIQVFEVLERWEEGSQDDAAGTANYTQRLSGTAWTAAGVGPGSRGTDVLADWPPITTQTQWTKPLPIAHAQGWVDDPDTNFGYVFVSESVAGRGCQFHSSESAEVAKRPRLSVTYVPPS